MLAAIAVVPGTTRVTKGKSRARTYSSTTRIPPGEALSRLETCVIHSPLPPCQLLHQLLHLCCRVFQGAPRVYDKVCFLAFDCIWDLSVGSRPREWEVTGRAPDVRLGRIQGRLGQHCMLDTC